MADKKKKVKKPGSRFVGSFDDLIISSPKKKKPKR